MSFTAAVRAKSRAALRGHWQTALLVVLVVNLPSLLVQGLAVFTNNDMMTRMMDLVLQAYDSEAAMNTLSADLKNVILESGVLAMAGISLLAWLVVIPVLNIGMIHWVLDRIRGEEEPVFTVFSRLRIFRKSIGLHLLITLKVLPWTLPGLAVSLLSSLLLGHAAAETPAGILSADLFPVDLIGLWLMSQGMILMWVLGIMGYMRYAVAGFILADEPEERILSCARRSRDLMKGRLGKLFSLWFSFVPLYLLVIFVPGIAEGIAGPVVSLMLQMLGNLFLSIYMLTAEGVFYEALRLAPAKEIPAEPASES